MLKADDRAIYDKVMAPQRTGFFVAGSATEDALALARDLYATGLAIAVDLRSGSQVKETIAFLNVMGEKYSDLACAVTLRCVDPNDPDFDLPPTSDDEADSLRDAALSVIGCEGAINVGTSAPYGFRVQWLNRVVGAQRAGQIVGPGALSGGGEARPSDWQGLLALGSTIWKETVSRGFVHDGWCGPALTRLDLLDTRPSRLEGFGMDRRDLLSAAFAWCVEHEAAVSIPLLCESGDAAYSTLGLARELRETVGIKGVWVPRWRPTALPVDGSSESVMRDIFAATEAFDTQAGAYGPLTRWDAADSNEWWWAATDGMDGLRGSPQNPVYGTLQSIAASAYKGG